VSTHNTTPPNKGATHSLQPANGLQRRTFPALEAEIGADNAALLLQLDHWIATQGENGWLQLSAPQMQYAFPTWSVRKLQRGIEALADAAYILLSSRKTTRGQWPLISLNLLKLATLTSIKIAETTKSTFTQPNPEPPTQPGSDTGDAPSPQIAGGSDTGVGGGPTLVSQGSDTGVAPDSIYIESFLRVFSSDQKRESLVLEDRAPANGKSSPPLADLINQFKDFYLEIATLCQLDPILNHAKLDPIAESLWSLNYRKETIQDISHYWYQTDWRGAKNNTPPHPAQVLEVVRAALAHPDTERRRRARDLGIDPDADNADRYRYITGDLADYVDY